MKMKKITPLEMKSNALWRLDKKCYLPRVVIKDVDEPPA